MAFRCTLHGSFQRDLDAVLEAKQIFEQAGIKVVSQELNPRHSVENGFVFFPDQAGQDSRQIELEYLGQLRRLGSHGFSYFANPSGYLGPSAAYELGIAQATNVPCFFWKTPREHPVYLHRNSFWSPRNLADYIKAHQRLPQPIIRPNEAAIHQLWEDLIVPGSIVAVGAMIEYPMPGDDPELLFVQTHKWGGRWSIVGEKVRWGERLDAALLRGIREETDLAGQIGRLICAFDQLADSGYYQPTDHIFIDKIVSVRDRRVVLDRREAETHTWLPAQTALAELDLEPNARHTLELYLHPQAA